MTEFGYDQNDTYTFTGDVYHAIKLYTAHSSTPSTFDNLTQTVQRLINEKNGELSTLIKKVSQAHVGILSIFFLGYTDILLQNQRTVQ